MTPFLAEVINGDLLAVLPRRDRLLTAQSCIPRGGGIDIGQIEFRLGQLCGEKLGGGGKQEGHYQIFHGILELEFHEDAGAMPYLWEAVRRKIIPSKFYFFQIKEICFFMLEKRHRELC